MSSSVQYSSNPQSTGAPKIRRRRLTLFAIILIGILFYLFSPWNVPGLSRANISQLMRTKKAAVEEIYGLLYLATGDHEQQSILNQVDLDPTAPIALSTYADKDSRLDWHKEQARMNKEYPVVVFSKTYCPYSKRAKQLLESYGIQPAPKVIEVDLRADGNMIKHILTRLTHHSTFPNIILQGKSIGGSDRLQQLHMDGKLKGILEDAGASVRSPGSIRK